MKNSKSFYITTPIYYVNSTPHLGHAYTSILCDVVNRYHHQRGENTYFLTGTDEHGDKIQKVAAEQGISPQELTDKNSAKFRELLKIINVKNDHFIRTTDHQHRAVVTQYLQKIYDAGDIYFKEFSGKYCYGCERYYSDDELVEGKCPDHQVAPTIISEQNYFFRMSKYWAQLKEHVAKNENFIVPSHYRNEVIGLLAQEPLDLCISRPKTRLTWGIELPFDKNFVTYVWFDALINYLSGLKNGPIARTEEEVSSMWDACHHVMAKDILKPHCVYWPTMLMAMGLPLPKQVIIHGYWLIDEQKMSKSLGNSVHPEAYCEKYTADVFRYFLIRGMNFGRDASFTHQLFVETCNADLSNNLGNLLARVLGMCAKNFANTIPSAAGAAGAEGVSADTAALQIKQEGLALRPFLESEMNDWQLHRYVERVMEYANSINKYIQDTKPWALAKDTSDPLNRERLALVLNTALEGVRLCFTYLSPVIPAKAEEVLQALGLTLASAWQAVESNEWPKLIAGAQLPEKAPGFPRIEA